MLLDEYIFKNKTTLSQMAKDIGCSYHYLSHIKNGKVVPTMAMANKIEKTTNGQVNWHELMSWCYEQKKNKEEL